MLRRNLIANYLGQSWAALMAIAFIPLYIEYLGIEAYSLIGIFALLQAWLNLLDMGMTPTLGREMARLKGGIHTTDSIRNLLRSVEIIALGIAALFSGSIVLGSNWIATSWLQVETMPVEVVVQAFVVMGLVSAIRFIENIYNSSILGLQQHVLFNVVRSTMATLRGLGAVGVLVWVSASIEAFFIWQGLVSIVTLIIMATITYAKLPRKERAARFSLEALRDVWCFASGMIGITFLSLLLTQVDKILLSKLLSLSEYGYYALAAVVASTLYTAILPITQAFYPRLCELYACDDQTGLITIYHKGAQLVSVIGGSVAIVIILFGETFLRLWTQNPELAQQTAPLLSLLMLGNLLNSLMWVPYQTQLAHGWTTLTMYMNTVAVTVIIPAILWVTPRYGAEGAAWVWVGLNAFYVFIGIHFMYRHILSSEKWLWYFQDVFIPLLAGAGSAGVFAIIWKTEKNNLADIIQLSLAILVTLIATSLAAPMSRQILCNIIRPSWSK